MESSPVSRAVFLSYAREDSDAARCVADALRAFGVEVQFDPNELRGGDSWDAKIRKPMRRCFEQMDESGRATSRMRRFTEVLA